MYTGFSEKAIQNLLSKGKAQTKKHKHFNNKAETARREKKLLNIQANISHNRNTKNRVESVYYIFDKSCQCNR